MSYCLNPNCPNAADPLNRENPICRQCGSSLLLQGRYRVRRLLGEGGFAKTFEVEDRGTLKVLKVLLDRNPKAVSLFQREAQVLSQLHHPGIPQVQPDGYFTFTPRNRVEPLHCLVMERIEGRNLLEWMSDRHHLPIPQPQALKWFQQLTEILDRVHRQQFFHRDIKPSNIMLKLSGQLALIDFGSAREVTGTYLAKVGGGHNITGIVSPGYTPPEQANGKAVPQSDFYALGRTFVFLLTGKEPNEFPEDPRTGQLQWRQDRSGRFPTNAQIPNPLADLIDYMMAPFPGNRPPNTQAILQRLAELEREMQQPWGGEPLQQRSPLCVGSIQPLQSVARIPTRLNQFRQIPPHSRRRSRFKYKKTKLTQRLLATGFVAVLFGTAVQLYGELRLPRFSGLLSLGGSTQSVIPEAVAESNRQVSLVSRPTRAQTSHNLSVVKTLAGHLRGVNSVQIDPDGRTIVSGSVDKTVKIWDRVTGEVRHSLSGHSQEIWSVAIAPDGNTIASASGDGTIKLWDTQTGRLLHTLSDHSAWVMSVTFSPNGEIVASGGFDNTIKLWRVSTGEQIATLSGHTGWVFSLAFSPDGQTLASGSFDNTIKIWHVNTGELMRTLDGGYYRFRSVAFSPDGQWVAGGSGDSTILIWQVSSGQLVRTLYGHSDAVHAIAFIPHTSLLASGGGSLDSTIKLWDLATGQLLKTLKAHSDTIHSLSIAADGKTLTSGSQDNTIKVWQLQ
ncbi:serine/threonine-protein kinase [Phormidium sp. CCY1219]|uniref:serine/threonine-protein kinase n=1 Tax=Phormidium sp. CCY1219 TaxID=2886104 RepID=UPI002D1F81EA|nr:serine/threonine-protein kinase [Phormidium sp. CCY1219]MEB3827738.1 serine/threonine protein kinase [Phormidium sp. CCY1219]